MVSLEWDPNYVPPVKLGLHIAQIVASFVLWCIAIAVFRGEDAKIVGNNGWTFGVVSNRQRPYHEDRANTDECC
jgi:hypothetical protein